MSLLAASHFLTGSLLSWGMPLALLIAVGIYWAVLLRRRSDRTR